MAESGCLHNKKFDTVETTGDIDGKNMLIKNNISNPHIAGINTSSNRFSCETLYSCGTDKGKYLNRSHYISSDLDLDKDNKLFSKTGDVMHKIPYTTSEFNSHFDEEHGYRFAVEGDGCGSIHEKVWSTVGRTDFPYYQNIYNNVFISILDDTKTVLKSDDGIVKLNDNNYDEGNTRDFTWSENIDSNFNYFVRWPQMSVLHDLIIIPNKDVSFRKSGAYSATVDTKTQEMFEREMTINLIQVSEITASAGRIGVERTSHTQNNGQIDPATRSRTPGSQIFRENVPRKNRNVTNTTEIDANPPLRGIIHRGRYMQLNRTCPYLIREFPIVAAPNEPTGATPTRTTWGKHTPIYAIQNGQPLQILHAITQNQPSDKKTYHQHETCRTTETLRHGSLDSNPKFAISREHSEDGSNSEEPPQTRNSASSTRRAKQLQLTTVPPTFIESTEFSYSHSKRRDGSQVKPSEFDPRFNALTRISTGMFNFNDDIRGAVENPDTDFDESSENKPTIMKKGATGTFYNSSNEEQYLMLNIGQNSHYKTPHRDGAVQDYDNTRPAEDLSIGGVDITPPTSQGNTPDDGEVEHRELDLRFKAIFIFKHIM